MSDQARCLRMPLRLQAGQLACVEQDTATDVAQCLLHIGRTLPGTRPDLPELGVDPDIFVERPLPTAELQAALTRWEPRGEVRVTETPVAGAPVEQAIAQLTVEFTATEDTDGR